MAKPASPFTGIKLSEPVAVPQGPDQRLFSTPPPVPQPRPITSIAKEPRKQGTLEPRQTVQTESPKSDGAAAVAFDITKTPYKNNTYAFTEEELWAIQDTENELERKHHLDVTKYNLIRLGIHFLIEDFRRNQAESFVVKRLRAAQK